MKISDVLRLKGTAVVTIAPRESVSDLLALLAEHRIGAAVVSEDGRHVVGIVSERDVVRHLHSTGVGILELPVSEIMTSDVYSCLPDDNVEDTALSMTEHRIRHLPVVSNGELVAIVSIGDIVKHRIDQLTSERDHLVGYINQ